MRYRLRSAPFLRGMVTAALTASLTVGAILPNSGQASIPGDFCVGGSSVKGIGSYTQGPVWSNHFLPRYEQRCPAGVNQISYDPLGDDAAIEAAIKHDLGDISNPYLMYATDLPMTSAEKYQAEMDTRNAFRPALLSFINHFPAFVFGVGVGYNLDTCPSTTPLKLSSRQLSLIYSGAISAWNDPLLVFGEVNDLSDDNAFLSSCSLAIRAAVRLDPSSSTLLFKDYLSRDNPLFNVYKTKELNTVWPPTLRSVRGLGDNGMSTYLSLPGTIGYVPYQEARTQSYKLALVSNSSKTFVAPATNAQPGPSRTPYPSECAVAAESVVAASTTQDWSRITMTNTANGYPLCSFSYLLVYQRLIESYQRATANTQARSVTDFLTVMAEDATQDTITSRGVAPLGPSMRALVRNGISLLMQ